MFNIIIKFFTTLSLQYINEVVVVGRVLGVKPILKIRHNNITWYNSWHKIWQNPQKIDGFKSFKIIYLKYLHTWDIDF